MSNDLSGTPTAVNAAQKGVNMKRLTLAVALILSMIVSGCGMTGSSQSSGNIEPETAAETETAAEAEYVPFKTDPDAPDKSESVHVEADASGRPEKITVEATLKNPGNGKDIPDSTNLSAIKNKEGDEEYTLTGSDLVFEDHGGDIKYEGTSSSDLPVTVKVTYYLDGEEILPDDLAGKSGHVKIRFDYENNTIETVTVKDAEYQVPIPFTAVTAAFLPADSFSNIKAENGKVIKMDDQAIVMGVALPGLKKTLRLEAWEPAEDIDIPDFVEIEADASDFSLDFTATMITNGLLEDLKEEDLEDLYDMSDGMDDLTEAIDDLTEGTDDLYEGLDEVQDYLDKYVDGVKSLDKGIGSLADGVSKMSKQKEKLAAGADTLSNGLHELLTSVNTISAGSAGGEDPAELLKAIKNLSSQAKDLSALIEAADQDHDEMVQFTEDASACVKKMKKSYKKAKKALKEIDLQSIDSKATSLARKQAAAAVGNALADSGLSKKQIKKIKKKVRNSIDLSGVSDEQAAKVTKAIDRLSAPKVSVPEISWDREKAQKLLKKMNKQMDIIISYSDALLGMTKQAAALGKTLSGLSEGVNALSKGSDDLATGVKAFCKGVNAIDTGASQLKSGSKQLKKAGGKMVDGMGELKDGVKEMSDGLNDFKEDGLEDLKKTAGPEMKRIVNTIKALKESDTGYFNYSGILPGKTGEVRFLIETEEIKKD